MSKVQQVESVEEGINNRNHDRLVHKHATSQLHDHHLLDRFQLPKLCDQFYHQD